MGRTLWIVASQRLKPSATWALASGSLSANWPAREPIGQLPIGVDLGRADVIGVNLTGSVHRHPGVLRATLVRLEPETGLRDELTRYGKALAEVEV
jgi:hypothetical protein